MKFWIIFEADIMDTLSIPLAVTVTVAVQLMVKSLDPSKLPPVEVKSVIFKAVKKEQDESKDFLGTNDTF